MSDTVIWRGLFDRAPLALAGMLCIGATLGMAMAHNMLIDAGLVGSREGAEVLALRGIAILALGVILIVAAIVLERY